mgnify:FL=1
MTERYILLVGNHYYPTGWDDYVGTFTTVEKAKDRVYCQDYKWAQVVDKESMKLVCECWDFEALEHNAWVYAV